MKRNNRIVAMIMAGLMTGALMTGCGNQAEDPAATQPETTQETETTEAETEAVEETGTEAEAEEPKEESTQLANPWRECTAEEAKEACPRLFKAPDDAMVNGWTMMDVDSEDGIPGPIVQLDFRSEGKSFTARAQYGAGENDNIDGMNYDWTVSDEVTLANWGEGNMKGVYNRYVGDSGMVDLLTWYDYEIGIAYSVSVEADDLDGFDLEAIAEQMYDASNEPLADAPDEEAAADNPVAAYAGQYYIGKGNLSISPEGADGALIQVWWGSSAAEHSEWVMHGTFDESTKTITYSDCEKHDITLNENSEVEKDETAYTNGTGSVKINDNGSVIWIDDQDHIADDLEMTK